MRIGYIQYCPAFGERDANLATLERLVTDAQPADLLVLPELAATGYEFLDADEVRQHAEPLGDGPTSQWARALARATGTTLVLGYPESAGAQLFNSAMLATPDGALHNYRKLHLFSREKELFTRGDAPAPVIDTPAGRVGILICFDWIFPEVARSLAVRGAQILAHPSNLVLPGLCQRAMTTRCLENRVFAITGNRIGVEERVGRRLRYTGLSQVLDTRGNLLVGAPEEEPHVGVVEVDVSKADDKEATEYNDLFADRRPELYAGL
jgi:predicted amidohydrolase